MKNITTDLLIKCLYENSEGTKYFSLLVVLPDGLLASGSMDSLIRIWNVTTFILLSRD